MSEQPEVGAEPRSRWGLSGTQKTLILGAVMVAAFLVGVGVTSMLQGEEGPSPQTAEVTPPSGTLTERLPAGHRSPLPERRLEGFADGPEIDLTAYRGSPLVVNFWASWCAPCVKEMPDFQEVAEQAGDRVGFLGINVQDAPRNAEAFADELGITYDLARDPAGELYNEVRAVGMPTTLFVDADGQVVWRHTGLLDAQDLRETIAERLDVEL
jgi:cytochrome c biogenesis protein CcmG, thiol:disulfide interchange protein DsbE